MQLFRYVIFSLLSGAASAAQCPPVSATVLGRQLKAAFRVPNFEAVYEAPTPAEAKVLATALRARIGHLGGAVKSIRVEGTKVHLGGWLATPKREAVSIGQPKVLSFHAVATGPMSAMAAVEGARKLTDFNHNPIGLAGPSKILDAVAPPQGTRWVVDPGKGRVLIEIDSLGRQHFDPCPAVVLNDLSGPVVQLRFTAAGAKALEALSTRVVGKALAIVIDGVLISAPIVMEPIPGGTAMINFGRDHDVIDALLLAAALQSPPIPSGVRLLHVR